MPRVRSFTVLPALAETLKDLEAIAKNMFWSWNADAEALLRRIDSNLWAACGHNPVKLLGTVSQKRLDELSEDEGFLCELRRTAENLSSYLEAPGWFQKACSLPADSSIAYFSAEFGIHECLPFYAGGLGVLAADHLKSASDLGVPIVGVGLLYQKGYFRQYLNIDGWQQELYIENDFYNMPIEPVQDENGRPLTISVEYPGTRVAARIWCAHIGKVKLYLLDTNVEENSPANRMITANLYGGNRETRIQQEIMLGIGGLRALAAMGIRPSVCHMNEGHAAFMALERIRQVRAESNLTFEQAAEATKAGNIFTIHTPVKAGLDEFSVELMDKYFAGYWRELGISRKQFFGLGRINADDDTETFKMPVLAIRLSSYRNAVSKLHGQVSRSMWAELWPNVCVDEVPIVAITNGVHVKGWISDEMNRLYERYLGPDWADRVHDKDIWRRIDQIPDEELWRAHQRCKEHLIVFARNRLKAQMQRRGTYHTELNWAEEVLDPEAMTIGFARRFATYKRGNLLLQDPQRLVKMLSDQKRPVQIIFAGKAHPRDAEGKEIIRQIIHFANQYNVRRRIVFLEDYDINVAKFLIQGVDVWLNTPRRPLEASGTSGMKAAINGALNVSTLDGWWCEGYKPEGGWAIGAGENYDDPEYQDLVESKAVYNIFENEIVPLFYTRSCDNLPRSWIRRVKNSIRWITPRFNTHRMVRDYTRRFYNPALARWSYLTERQMARAKELSTWKARINSAWRDFAIREVKLEAENGQGNVSLEHMRTQLKVGARVKVRALVKLGRVGPDDVSVQLYHGLVDAWGNITKGSIVDMEREQNSRNDGHYWFAGLMTCEKTGQHGLTVRVLPRHCDLADPYEMGLILWDNQDG